MENVSQAEFLQTELDTQIERFKGESTKHKKMYRWIRYVIFVLAAMSTILAGIATSSEGEQLYNINVGILIIGAIIGVVNSFEGLRKPSELWVMERNLYYALKDLKTELEFDLKGKKGSKPLTKYFARMQVLLNSAGEKWNKNVQKQKLK